MMRRLQRPAIDCVVEVILIFDEYARAKPFSIGSRCTARGIPDLIAEFEIVLDPLSTLIPEAR